MAAYNHLSHHHRHSDQKQAQHIGHHKGSPTVLTGEVGETPQITQPNG